MKNEQNKDYNMDQRLAWVIFNLGLTEEFLNEAVRTNIRLKHTAEHHRTTILKDVKDTPKPLMSMVYDELGTFDINNYITNGIFSGQVGWMLDEINDPTSFCNMPGYLERDHQWLLKKILRRMLEVGMPKAKMANALMMTTKKVSKLIDALDKEQ